MKVKFYLKKGGDRVITTIKFSRLLQFRIRELYNQEKKCKN